MSRLVQTMLTAAFALAPTAVLAHTGHGDASGLVHGFTHPITGADHFVAMIAVGVLAAQLGGRALWQLPLAFVGIMVVGGAFGMARVSLPLAEFSVALSVVVFGLAIALSTRLPTLAVIALVGLFALFHGHVHGTEMPAAASGLYYTAGFVGATVLLHAVGVSIGLLFRLAREELAHRLAQAGGGATALVGIAVLGGFL